MNRVQRMTENPVDLRSLIMLKADNQRTRGLTVTFALNFVFKSCFTQLVVILIGNPAVLIIVVRLCVSGVRRIGYAVAVGISVPPHFNRIVVLLLQFSSPPHGKSPDGSLRFGSSDRGRNNAFGDIILAAFTLVFCVDVRAFIITDS